MSETVASEDRPPLVVVLTGPSGVGKDAVVNRAVDRGEPVVRPATMTTRAVRRQLPPVCWPAPPGPWAWGA